jgi:hypothetical protein
MQCIEGLTSAMAFRKSRRRSFGSVNNSGRARTLGTAGR